MNTITRDTTLDVIEVGERPALALAVGARQVAEAKARKERIAGLRALVDLLENSPDVPIPGCIGWEFAGHIEGRAVHSLANALSEAGTPSRYMSREGLQRLVMELAGLTVVFTVYPEAVTL